MGTFLSSVLQGLLKGYLSSVHGFLSGYLSEFSAGFVEGLHGGGEDVHQLGVPPLRQRASDKTRLLKNRWIYFG